MNKKITFDQYDATRILEWWYALVQGKGKPCCENCETIAKRLERFIKNPKALKKLVDKNPYFIKGKAVRYKK
jgi:hypothetical protein